MAALGPQVAKLPNVALVDRSRLETGKDVDTPEFTAAMAEYGFGITVFTGEEDPDAAGVRAAGDFRARLEWDQFYCHQSPGDQWGGRAEIYWRAASNALDYQRTTRTAETGSVVSNKWFSIPGDHATGNKALVDTPLKGGYVTNVITCWEADQSNAAWYSALGAMLRNITEAMRLSADLSSLVPGMDAYGYLFTALDLITTFWEAWRNYDDLVLSRGIALSRADLAAAYYAPNGHISLPFDARSTGMGNLTLYMKYTGDRPAARPGAVRYKTRTSSGWTNATAPGWNAVATPALASFQGQLYAVFPGQDLKLRWSRQTGTTWSAPQQIHAFASHVGAALAVYNNRLYLSHVGQSGTPHWNRFDGSTWRQERHVGWQTDTAPSAVSHAGKLLVAHRGYQSDHLHIGNHTDNTAEQPKTSWRTGAGPALTVHNNELWLVHRSVEEPYGLYDARGTAWSNWGGAGRIPDSSCTDEPTLASHGGNLHLMYRATPSTALHMHANGTLRTDAYNGSGGQSFDIVGQADGSQGVRGLS